MISKVKKLYRILRYLPHSIYFCMKVLPFKQAWKIPILLYKPKFFNLKGEVKIVSDNIKFGMIQLGFPINPMYPNNGFFLEICKGGLVVFNGLSIIGNSSGISVGPRGKLLIGNNVSSRTSLRICAYHYIEIGCNTLFAWDILIMDTNFHRLSSEGKKWGKGYEPIIIGNNTFIGSRATILKGTILPPYSVVGANSVLTSDFGKSSKVLVCGNPAKIMKDDIYWDHKNDKINYEYY